jgi:hypothetical protein
MSLLLQNSVQRGNFNLFMGLGNLFLGVIVCEGIDSTIDLITRKIVGRERGVWN